jgi:hypothetical protein
LAKLKKKSFTAQIKTVAMVDYEIEAENFEEALNVAKGLTVSDIFEQQEGVIENDSRTQVVGIFGGEDWDTDRR